MHHHYRDIMERIAEEPKWFDEEAVPRYCDFSPTEVANIYCDEVALVLISCQACDTPFKVAFSSDKNMWVIHRMDRAEYIDLKTKEEQEAWFKALPAFPLSANIESLHYGDPPNIGCCPAGPTMNCMDIKVLEYWRCDYNKGWEWIRMPEFEVMLPDHPEYRI